MPTSRYDKFKTVKTYTTDPRRLETFPPISAADLSNVPHTVIKFKETDRLDHLAQDFLGDASYWWAICLMNNLENPFSYRLLPGFLLKIPNNIDFIINMVQRTKAGR